MIKKADLKTVENEPTEAEMIKASDRARLQACAPEIRAIIASMTGKVTRDAMKAIDKGTMEPDYAYNLWLEYYAAWKMEKKLLIGVAKE